MKKLFDYSCYVIIALGLLIEPAKADVVSYVLTNGTPQAVSVAKPLPTTATFVPSGTLDVNIKQVNGTSVTNPLPVTGSYAQGSTTSGQSLMLTGCAVTTGDSAFTAGQTEPCTMSTTGRVKVGLSSAVTNGAVAATINDLMGGKAGDGNQYPLLIDTSGRLITSGAVPDGSSNTANPFLIAGTNDGTNTGTVDVVQVSSTGTMNVGGSVASGATDTGFPVKVGCVNNTTLPTVTNAQRVDCQADIRGGQLIVIKSAGGTAQAGVVTPAAAQAVQAGLATTSQGVEYNGATNDPLRTIQGVIANSAGDGLGVAAVEESGRTFNNITTATTTVVKSTIGILHTITINTPVALATITIYNNNSASGGKIATITLPSTITSDLPITLTYDIFCSGGITVVTSGLTDVTVSYR